MEQTQFRSAPSPSPMRPSSQSNMRPPSAPVFDMPTGTYADKENVQVMIRVRPLLQRESSHGKAIEVADNQTVRILKGHTPTEMNFDNVFDEQTSQEEVYDCVKASIEAVLQGINSAIFAYGQTGTGKTYTMLGLDCEAESATDAEVQAVVNAELRGIIPRAVQQIFDHLQHSPDGHCQVFCSYMEIYNEKIYDLLQYERTMKLRAGLELREDRFAGVFVQDLSEVEVTGVHDVLSLMLQGARNRAIAHTEMNDYSSRSHTIFQLTVESHEPGDDGIVRRAKLNLVDLAGSEKWRTSYDLGPQRIQELTSINQSLSTLGNCISALTQSRRSHIPFRESKLTRLLQDSLGGNTRTSFIATASPSITCLEETCSTLKFADRAKRVVLNVHVNEQVDESMLLKRYEREIARLKAVISTMSSVGPSGDQSAALMQQIKSLDEENAQLKAESSRAQMWLHQEREERQRLLRVFKQALEAMRSRSTGGVTPSSGEAAAVHEADMFRVENEFLRAKIAQLESMEYDQKARQSELDNYHRWLRSVPLQYDGERYTASMKDKLEMLEKSIHLQQTELQRTKKLFTSDIVAWQGELRSKCDELGDAEQREAALQHQLASIQRMLSQGDVQKATTTATAAVKAVAQAPAVVSSAPKSVAFAVGVDPAAAQRATEKMQVDLQQLETTFRSNLDGAFNMLRDRFLGKQPDEVRRAAEPLHMNTAQVVTGCLNALFSAVRTIQQDAVAKLSQAVPSASSVENRSSASVGDTPSAEVLAELEQLRQLLSASDQRNAWQSASTQQQELRRWQTGILSLLRFLKRYVTQTDSDLASAVASADADTLISNARRSLQVLSEYTAGLERDFNTAQFGGVSTPMDVPTTPAVTESKHAARRPVLPPLETEDSLAMLVQQSTATGVQQSQSGGSRTDEAQVLTPARVRMPQGAFSRLGTVPSPPLQPGTEDNISV
eukprot:TRINITY_DN1219_c0_g1_i1.p1 TRINITY_DN1219_c0_g1~~TRINITY_DN1219_c0_g1_i1.p1  ORF type:complete len:953 (+),score=263.25 TRINITY_DN1219_c0_g1_i1:164-3022(+)